jgi:hypothetical protein
VAYRIVSYPEAEAQVATLPFAALPVYGQVLDVLQLTPWEGRPANPGNPAGAVRVWVVDRLLVVYLIVEDQQRVDIIDVVWHG